MPPTSIMQGLYDATETIQESTGPGDVAVAAAAAAAPGDHWTNRRQSSACGSRDGPGPRRRHGSRSASESGHPVTGTLRAGWPAACPERLRARDEDGWTLDKTDTAGQDRHC
jgi:hypothetical protein